MRPSVNPWAAATWCLAAIASLSLAGCPGKAPLFTASTAIPYPDRVPVAVRAADLDGDGDIDVVTANDDTYAVTLHWNRGDGRLAPGVLMQLVTTEKVLDVQIADATGDGVPDLVMLLSKGVAILGNGGHGQFAVDPTNGRVAPCTGCSALVTGDFNGDGVTDLYVVGATQSDLWPGPTYKVQQSPPPPHLLVPPRPVRANLDGNAIDDLLGMRTGTSGAPEVVALLGSQAGTFTDQSAPSLGGRTVSVLAAGDIDGDGIDDAIIAGPGYIGAYLKTKDGFGPLLVHPVPGLDPVGLAAFDATNDGRTDIIVGDKQGAVHVYVGGGKLSFLVDEDLSPGPDPAGLAHGDLDGDGYQDLVEMSEGTCCPPQGAGLTIYQGGPLTQNRPSFTLAAP